MQKWEMILQWGAACSVLGSYGGFYISGSTYEVIAGVVAPCTGSKIRPPIHHGDIGDVETASSSCLNHGLFASGHSSDDSPPQPPLPAHDFSSFSINSLVRYHFSPLHLGLQLLLRLPQTIGYQACRLSFLDQQPQDDSELATFLGLSEGASSERGMIQPSECPTWPFMTPLCHVQLKRTAKVRKTADTPNAGPDDRRPLHHHSDILSRGSQTCTRGDTRILPLPRPSNYSSHRLAAAFPLDRPLPHTTTPTVLPALQVSSETPLPPNPNALSGLETSPQPNPHASSARSGDVGSKRKNTSSTRVAVDADDKEAQLAIKRQRNTMAARKYRQKHLDRVAHLEKALDQVTGERNELRLELARREAELNALRGMLARNGK
ncbi:hypothetical protein E4U42_005256 [Claviceps africana]|uniref:BZIP domain-containing protein n=1 Tax=Claviceps africana TaxID=83212 RepID=A0A8K0NFN1_9HYPO|nr:hypothetical protein E4U42_005256 [Claviceps africana]